MHLVFDALTIEVAMEIGKKFKLLVDVESGDDRLKHGSNSGELNLGSARSRVKTYPHE